MYIDRQVYKLSNGSNILSEQKFSTHYFMSTNKKKMWPWPLI